MKKCTFSRYSIFLCTRRLYVLFLINLWNLGLTTEPSFLFCATDNGQHTFYWWPVISPICLNASKETHSASVITHIDVSCLSNELRSLKLTKEADDMAALRATRWNLLCSHG